LTSNIEPPTFVVVDLNHIFLFIAVVSPLLVLVRGWRPGGIFRGWRVAAVVVLAITGVAWLFFREHAGYVGGGAWFTVLFLPAVALRRASELAAKGRYQSARRLATALQYLHPTAQVREQVRLFRALELRESINDHAQTQNPPQDRHSQLRNAPAVAIFIAANLLVFGVELWRGALSNPAALHRLGVLDPVAVIAKGEFWRLFTALFLHYNLLHLAFNLFALYILGPPFERTIGTVQFAGCYLISGIGSTGGNILLTLAHVVRPAELIGASGCVMGIVGAWAGFLLRHRHTWRAKERLLNILLIVGIQLIFDVLTPGISMSAHLCGLVTGFVVGLAVAPKKAPI
jgi:rhomboid protease GluP